MARFRKKPVVIEATQYTRDGSLAKGVCYCHNSKAHVHTIHTKQEIYVEEGDWIIPEPDGKHFYPCKPNIFEATYELEPSPNIAWVPFAGKVS